MAFLLESRTEQAQKLLETPGLAFDKGKVKYALHELAHEGTEAAEAALDAFVTATAELYR